MGSFIFISRGKIDVLSFDRKSGKIRQIRDIENGNFVFSDDRLHKKFTSARQDIDFLWNIAIRAIIFATNFIYCCCFQFYNNVIYSNICMSVV